MAAQGELGALLRASAERDEVYRLAGLPTPLPALVPTRIPASVQRLLDRVPDTAIAVYTVHWTLLSANRAWVALLGPLDRPRNLVEQP